MAVDAGGEPHGLADPCCLLLTGAEVMVSITGLEFAYTRAPRHMKSFTSLVSLTVSPEILDWDGEKILPILKVRLS